jgi:chromosome segregation ATPase
MFCVFNGKPAMDYAIRMLPDGAHAEEGVPKYDSRKQRGFYGARRSSTQDGRASSQSSLAEIASQIAGAISQPLRIEHAENVYQNEPQKEHSEMAGTVLKLLELESKMQQCPAECASEDERKEVLRARLRNVSDRIASSMGLPM